MLKGEAVREQDCDAATWSAAWAWDSRSSHKGGCRKKRGPDSDVSLVPVRLLEEDHTSCIEPLSDYSLLGGGLLRVRRHQPTDVPGSNSTVLFLASQQHAAAKVIPCF